MFNEYDFEKCLAFSRGRCSGAHEDVIREFLGESCVRVEQVEGDLNRKGIDYRAYLRRGATVDFDMKERVKGCADFWKDAPLYGIFKPEPELALEKWSVYPNGRTGKVGWTLDESKETHYTLHRFDPADTDQYFVLPFQLLRMAFRKNIDEWFRRFKHAKQSSGAWQSECVFVPACHVIAAIEAQMRR